MNIENKNRIIEGMKNTIKKQSELLEAIRKTINNPEQNESEKVQYVKDYYEVARESAEYERYMDSI